MLDKKYYILKGFLVALVMVFFFQCSSTKNTVSKTPPPPWIANTPVSSMYYIGIGAVIPEGIWALNLFAKANTSDDSIGLTSAQQTAIANNTNKVSQGLSTANHTLDFSVVNSRGSYSLVFTIVDSSGRTPVTKTATLALR